MPLAGLIAARGLIAAGAVTARGALFVAVVPTVIAVVAVAAIIAVAAVIAAVLTVIRPLVAAIAATVGLGIGDTGGGEDRQGQGRGENLLHGRHPFVDGNSSLMRSMRPRG